MCVNVQGSSSQCRQMFACAVLRMPGLVCLAVTNKGSGGHLLKQQPLSLELIVGFLQGGLQALQSIGALLPQAALTL